MNCIKIGCPNTMVRTPTFRVWAVGSERRADNAVQIKVATVTLCQDHQLDFQKEMFSGERGEDLKKRFAVCGLAEPDLNSIDCFWDPVQ